MLHPKKNRTGKLWGPLDYLAVLSESITGMLCDYSSYSSCSPAGPRAAGGAGGAGGGWRGWIWRLPSLTCKDTAMCSLQVGARSTPPIIHSSLSTVYHRHLKAPILHPSPLLCLHFWSNKALIYSPPPCSICRGSSAMQVKRLQCLRENQLMPFISLQSPR